jgi:hypothetical protein
MPRAGFEPVISTFERSKTVLASDRSAVETGLSLFTNENYKLSWKCIEEAIYFVLKIDMDESVIPYLGGHYHFA